MSSAAAATRLGMRPRFSLATMYAPPELSYTCTVCRYERTTIASSAAIAIEIGKTRCAEPADGRDEHDERRLGRVRDRRERVRREDRKREPLREERLVHLVGRHRTSDEVALDPGHDLARLVGQAACASGAGPEHDRLDRARA